MLISSVQVELTPEQQERKKLKAAADVHKDKGNVAYKSKSFEEAIGHYEKVRTATISFVSARKTHDDSPVTRERLD